MFVNGDTVYTQDGTNYYFDHIAGDHGYVRAIIIVQTTSYHGDDFEEHETESDYLVPIHISKLSKTPWVWKIHQETADAVAEKQTALDALSKQIGAARVELATTKADCESQAKGFENDARILARRFQWVKDFRRLIGEEDLFMIAENKDDPTAMPYRISAPTDIRLKKTSGTATWNYSYVGQYEDDEDHIRMFPTEAAMESHAFNLFTARRNDMDVEEQLKWLKHWPKVPITGETQLHLKAQADEKHDRELKAAQGRVLQAQEALERIQNGEEPTRTHAKKGQVPH